MTICRVCPIENYNGEWGAIRILPVPCSPLIEVALYYSKNEFCRFRIICLPEDSSIRMYSRRRIYINGGNYSVLVMGWKRTH